MRMDDEPCPVVLEAKNGISEFSSLIETAKLNDNRVTLFKKHIPDVNII